MPRLHPETMDAFGTVLHSIRESFAAGIERGARPRHLVIDAIRDLERACFAMRDHLDPPEFKGQVDPEAPRMGDWYAISPRFGEFAERVRPVIKDILEDPDQVFLAIGTEHEQERWRQLDASIVLGSPAALALLKVLETAEEIDALSRRPPDHSRKILDS